MLYFIDVQEINPKGNWLYFNPTKIVALEHADNSSGCIIHANGRTYQIIQSLDAVKEKLRKAGCTIP